MKPFSRKQREEILLQYGKAYEAYNRAMDNGYSDLAEKFRLQYLAAEIEYFRQLHRIVMSCCPFDGKPLVRSFDPYGLDGLWWEPSATPEELPTCPHFCVLLGAVNYAGNQPRGGNFETHPGPEVPYIIPRLLNYPGMIAVISQVNMEPGYMAFPIAYFAERRPPPQELTAGWARTQYVYTTQLGKPGWKTPNDPWDFDLLPWLKAGKIRWCPPDSDRTTLSTDPPEQCPYLDLPGKRERIIIEGDKSWGAGVPIGDVLPEMG